MEAGRTQRLQIVTQRVRLCRASSRITPAAPRRQSATRTSDCETTKSPKPLTQNPFRFVMPRWRLMKRSHGDRRDEETRREPWTDGWMKGAVLVGGKAGGGEERRGEGVERLILWHHIGSYKLREWSPTALHKQPGNCNKGEAWLELKEEKKKKQQQHHYKLLLQASFAVCVWPVPIWTRPLLRWLLQCGIFFFVVFFFPPWQDAGTVGVYASPLFHMRWTLHR